MSLKMNFKNALCVAFMGLAMGACDKAGSSSADLKTETDSVSYVIGTFEGDQIRKNLDMADSMREARDGKGQVYDRKLWLKNIQGLINQQPALTEGDSMTIQGSSAEGMRLQNSLSGAPFEIDKAIFLQAYEANLNNKSAITVEQAQEFWKGYMPKLQAKQQAKMDSLAEVNLAEAQKFLEENKTKEGIQVRESGVQVEILTQGEGATVTENSEITAHYTGTFLNGEKFDSSVDRGKPMTFKFGQLIKGWDEIKGMKVGTKCKLYIPSELAYGKAARPPIEPNQALIFEIEIVGAEELPAEENTEK